ncbi:MAG: hypothetical protein WBR26_01750 [Candidatus Acidiferrum sp.]
MPLAHLAVLLAGPSLVMVAIYLCLSLLKTAQDREDAEDERVWEYLLNPRTL